MTFFGDKRCLQKDIPNLFAKGACITNNSAADGAFVYAALKLGFSIGGSTVAAIMGYAVLRGVMRVGTMAENRRLVDCLEEVLELKAEVG